MKAFFYIKGIHQITVNSGDKLIDVNNMYTEEPATITEAYVNECLEYSPRPENVLIEILSLIRRDGVIYINSPDLIEFARIVSQGEGSAKDLYGGKITMMTIENVEDILLSNGFEILNKGFNGNKYSITAKRK